MHEVPQAAITAAAEAAAISEWRAKLALEAAAPILAETWGPTPKRRPVAPVLTVPCPQCRAAAGERCRSRIPGSKLHYGPAASHGARVDAMREANKEASR